jgi:hypothetical protein
MCGLLLGGLWFDASCTTQDNHESIMPDRSGRIALAGHPAARITGR